MTPPVSTVVADLNRGWVWLRNDWVRRKLRCDRANGEKCRTLSSYPAQEWRNGSREPA